MALLAALILAVTPAVARGPLVLASSSLQEALNDAATAWASQGHDRPVLSFASASALARQIEAGAAADLFFSADEEWMDHLAERGLIRPKSRVTLLGNRLALIAPRNSAISLLIRQRMPIGQALGTGRLAMADPAAVPAGRYGRAALVHLGVWPDVARRIAPAENVRAALMLVERGAAPLGIVYATDARASAKVKLVGIFPVTSHKPIRYPLAVLTRSTHGDAEGFRRYLLSAPGKAHFAARGFVLR